MSYGSDLDVYLKSHQHLQVSPQKTGGYLVRVGNRYYKCNEQAEVIIIMLRYFRLAPTIRDGAFDFDACFPTVKSVPHH